MKTIVTVLFGGVAAVTVYTILSGSPDILYWFAVTAGLITSFFIGIVS